MAAGTVVLSILAVSAATNAADDLTGRWSVPGRTGIIDIEQKDSSIVMRSGPGGIYRGARSDGVTELIQHGNPNDYPIWNSLPANQLAVIRDQPLMKVRLRPVRSDCMVADFYAHPWGYDANDRIVWYDWRYLHTTALRRSENAKPDGDRPPATAHIRGADAPGEPIDSGGPGSPRDQLIARMRNAIRELDERLARLPADSPQAAEVRRNRERLATMLAPLDKRGGAALPSTPPKPAAKPMATVDDSLLCSEPGVPAQQPGVAAASTPPKERIAAATPAETAPSEQRPTTRPGPSSGQEITKDPPQPAKPSQGQVQLVDEPPSLTITSRDPMGSAIASPGPDAPAPKTSLPTLLERYGTIPGSRCGPDITKPLIRVLRKLVRTFKLAKASAQSDACVAAVHPLKFNDAWDIDQLSPGAASAGGFSNVSRSCAVPRDKCGNSVEFLGVCRNLQVVNYAMWGVMKRLCATRLPMPTGEGVVMDTLHHYIGQGFGHIAGGLPGARNFVAELYSLMQGDVWSSRPTESQINSTIIGVVIHDMSASEAGLLKPTGGAQAVGQTIPWDMSPTQVSALRLAFQELTSQALLPGKIDPMIQCRLSCVLPKGKQDALDDSNFRFNWTGLTR